MILICLTTWTIGCNQIHSNTASYIKVLEKGTSGKAYWAIALDPNSKEKKQFKLTVDSRNTWNLIEVGKEYFASYEYVSLDKKVDLFNIQYPAKP
jgi:hypothetical protein